MATVEGSNIFSLQNVCCIVRQIFTIVALAYYDSIFLKVSIQNRWLKLVHEISLHNCLKLSGK